LIYGMTRRGTEGSSSRECPLCKHDKDETENHLFLECDTILLNEEAMKTTLKYLISQGIDVERAVTINTIPLADPLKSTRDFKLITEFTCLVWTSSNVARYEEGKTFTPTDVTQIIWRKMATVP
jgi:hypothetical protein